MYYPEPEHPLNPRPYGQTITAQERKNYNIDLEINSELSNFIEILKKNNISVFCRFPNRSFINSKFFINSDKSCDSKQPRIFLMNAYKVGNNVGSGPDGDEGSQKFLANDGVFPKFSDWEKMLLLFWPDISHLENKELSNLVMSQVVWNVNEYYGDSSDYISYHIDLEKVFSIFSQENKLIPTHPTQNISDRFASAIKNLDTTPLITLNKEDRANPAPRSLKNKK